MNTAFATAELGSSYLLKPDADPPVLRTLYQVTWTFTEMSAQDLSEMLSIGGKCGFIKQASFPFRVSSIDR